MPALPTSNWIFIKLIFLFGVDSNKLTQNTFVKCPIIKISNEVMGGTPVFAGTRVPLLTLIDYLKAGDSIDDFLEGFPTVKREQVIEFLEETEREKKAK